MSVNVDFLNFGRVITFYSDTLQTPDSLNPNAGSLDGTKWILALTPQATSNTPVDSPTVSIGTSSKDAQNALLWAMIGAQNPLTQTFAHLLPVVCYLGCYGKSQFSQCTLVQASGTAGQGTLSCGLEVMANPGNNGGFWGYTFQVSTDDHSWILARRGSGTAVLATGGAGATADGDILRLSADLTTTGQVTLTVKKNGVQLTQFVDNTGTRLLLGSPGLCNIAPVVGAGVAKSDWRTFSCGVGL